MDINQINLKGMRKNMLATYGISQEPTSYDQLNKAEENDIEKGKKTVPIGTVSNGYKKIAEGKWQKVSDKGMTKKEHQEAAKAGSKNDKNHTQVAPHIARAASLDDKEYDDAHVESKNKPTVDEMEEALRDINFFVGGLTDEGIKHHYEKMVDEGKIKKSKSLEADETPNEFQVNEAATTSADMEKGSDDCESPGYQELEDEGEVTDFDEDNSKEDQEEGRKVGLEKSGIEETMKEFKEGTLRSSSGEKVTNKKQAIAIGLSEEDKVKKAFDILNIDSILK